MAKASRAEPADTTQTKRPPRPRLQLNRLLVATDLSPAAECALARAALLPFARGARILLLHVASEGGAEDQAAVRTRLDLARATLATQSKVEVDSELTQGDPSTSIVRVAREYCADLTVLGRHSESVLRIGATADRVVRTGSTPALIVSSHVALPYERPLVAVDLSDASAAVLDTASLVVRSAVTTRVMHAYHVPFEGFAASTSSEREALRHEYRERRRTAMAKLLSERSATHWLTTVRPGEPSSAIMRELVLRRADLLVIGTHGRSGLSRFFVGSTATWMIENAPCDVLIARPERFTTDLVW